MMKRIFKFFNENNTFSLNLEAPIAFGTPEPNYILPTPNHHYNYITYAETDPNRNWITRPVNMLFEWSNQFEYRELERIQLKRDMMDMMSPKDRRALERLIQSTPALREWDKLEVNFAQILASIYSFSHSAKETNKLTKELNEFKEFVNQKYGIAYGNIMGETPVLEEEAEDA